LLIEEHLPEDVRSSISTISESGKALLTVINDILDFSKVEAGKLVIERIPFSLKQVLCNCEFLLRRQARQNGLCLNLTMTQLPDSLYGDPSRIQQIVLNLVSNAIKFTKTGSVSIEADGYLQGGMFHLKLNIRDTGIGMDQETISRLFQPFMQADTSTTRTYGGTGLGLSICKRLVELMEGEIRVNSVVGVGSEFAVLLTLDVHKGGTPKPTMLNNMHSEPEDIRILIAEDNLVNQRIVSRLLAGIGFKNIDIVDNGTKAVDAIFRNSYDIVLMDVHMPIMDGLEATRIIRLNPKFKKLPIVAASASATEEDKLACGRAGMSYHISKPLNRAKLQAVIEKFCPR
jgi:CheY-like chemotaxis protein